MIKKTKNACVKKINSMINELQIRKHGAKENFAKHRKANISNYEELKKTLKKDQIELKMRKAEKKQRRSTLDISYLKGIKDELKDFLTGGDNNGFDIFDHIKFS